MLKKKQNTIELEILYNGLIFITFFGGPGRLADSFFLSFDAIYRMLALVMIIVQLLLYYKKSDLSININKRYIFLFLGIVIYSSVANSNNYLISLEEFGKLIITIAYAIFLVNNFSIKNILKMSLIAQFWITIMNCYLLFFESARAFDSYYGAFIGIYTTKNNLAYSLAFGLLLSLLFLSNYRKTDKSFAGKVVILVVVQLILIFKCMATGPIISLIVVTLCVYLLEKRKKNINLAYWFIGINTVFIFLLIIGKYFLAEILLLIGKTITLTGRTDLWEIIISNMLKGHYLTGYGFGTAWGTGSEIELNITSDYMNFLGKAPVGSHHLLLELWLQIGIIGVVAFIVMFCHAAYRSKFLKSTEYKTITNGILIFFILQSLVERTLGSMGYNTLFVFIVLTILLNYGEKKNYDKNLY